MPHSSILTAYAYDLTFLAGPLQLRSWLMQLSTISL